MPASFLALAISACGGGGGGGTALPTTSAIASGTTSTTLTSQGVASAPTSAPAYTGVVSGVGLGSTSGFTANCNNHNNFGQGFSCIPVVTTGATLVGTETAGAYFELWGTVNPPNVTATYVIFSSTPFSTSTASPAATSAPSTNMTNGAAWLASFQPYAGSPIWSKPLGANPQLDGNSSRIIAAWFPGSGNGFPVRNQEPGPYDYTHPIYFASNSDPVVSLTCSGNACQTSGNNAVPSSMAIPAVARSAESNGNGAGDSHLGVVQPDGSEVDLYCWNDGGSSTCDQNGGSVSNNWWGGAHLGNASGGDACGNFFNGTGQMPSTSFGNTTAGGACEGAGVLSPQQLIAGHINHALFLIVNCANGTVYPAQATASTNGCSGAGPALGARLWYDVPDSATEANSSLHPWERAILEALHDYGGYVMDDINGGSISQGIQFLPESEEPAYRYGMGDQWRGLASQGWTSNAISGAPSGYPRWSGADPWRPSGVNFNAHLHVLAPCVTQGTC